jgi:hypothetical protein
VKKIESVAESHVYIIITRIITMQLRSGRQIITPSTPQTNTERVGGYTSIELELVLYLHEKSDALKKMEELKYVDLFDSIFQVVRNTRDIYSTLTSYFTYIKYNPKFSSFLRKMYTKSVLILKNLEETKEYLDVYPNTKSKKRMRIQLMNDIEECEHIINEWQYHYPC